MALFLVRWLSDIIEDFEEVGTWDDTPLMDLDDNLPVIQDEDEDDETEMMDNSPSLK